jgi:hypothetical protein
MAYPKLPFDSQSPLDKLQPVTADRNDSNLPFPLKVTQ